MDNKESIENTENTENIEQIHNTEHIESQETIENKEYSETTDKTISNKNFNNSVKFFKIYFIEHFNMDHLITLCYDQNLCSVNLRSLVWKIFLNQLPLTKDKLFRTWLITARQQREDFFILKEKYSVELYNPDTVNNIYLY